MKISILGFRISIVTVFLIQLSSCQGGKIKVLSRFQNGVSSIAYEYPDSRDTSTYIYKQFYPNGKIRSKLQVKSNMIINYPTWYYPSGKVYEIDSMVHPRPRFDSAWAGTITRYSMSGRKIGRFEVKNGQIQSTEVFDTGGLLMKQYAVVKDTIKEGPYTEFYSNGMISVKATFHNDTLNGMMYFFNENGDTDRYYLRDEGEISMPYKKWLDNGEILSGKFTGKDQKTVLWCWYSKDGKEIKREYRYSKDREFAVPE